MGGAGFLQQLKEELLRLKFYEKNNDLYQFHQVNGFVHVKCISIIIDQLRHVLTSFMYFLIEYNIHHCN